MDDALTEAEVRVLGALIEKSQTTPEHYPLSLNALMTACNQTSNREPVVVYDEDTVARSIESLRRRGLVRAIKRVDSRVTKFQHLVDDVWNLGPLETALVCVLMLRGPQTSGELRTRSARAAAPHSLTEVESALDGLIARGTAYVGRLPRRPGQKETRYAHLLGGQVTFDTPDPAAIADPAAMPASAESERLARLEESVEELRRETADLRAQLNDFRRQFE